MKDYTSISTPEYDLHFWNALRGRNYNPAFLSKGATSETGIHLLPASDGGKFLGGIEALYNSTIYLGGKQHVGTITTTTCQEYALSKIIIHSNNRSFIISHFNNPPCVCKLISEMWFLNFFRIS